jgi:flagellar biosynthesis chaperone FliJ
LCRALKLAQTVTKELKNNAKRYRSGFENTSSNLYMHEQGSEKRRKIETTLQKVSTDINTSADANHKIDFLVSQIDMLDLSIYTKSQ